MEEDKEQLIEGQTNQEDDKPLSKEDVQKLIQSETDRVRTEYSKKLKALETEKEKLVKEKMSEEEIKALELKKAQDAIAQKERELNSQLLKLKAIDMLKEEGLDIEFKDYVLGEDEETMKTRIKVFKKQWDTAINKAVEAKFQNNSRSPNSSSEGLTKERINQMSIAEINANWENVSKVLEK
jgi:hypothetical protein